MLDFSSVRPHVQVSAGPQSECGLVVIASVPSLHRLSPLCGFYSLKSKC